MAIAVPLGEPIIAVFCWLETAFADVTAEIKVVRARVCSAFER